MKRNIFLPNDFVLTRTPHRVSFFGGGTDLESFYSKSTGVTLSTAINNYVYVGIKKHTKFFDEKYRIVYSKTELHNKLSKIENEIVRETLKFCNFIDPIYINSISDLPSGSGLGSSSAFTVGLLKGVYSLMNIKKNNIQLAEEACEIEIKKIKKPIGKQDQYACAIGGVNLIEYKSSGIVLIKKKENVKRFINKMMSSTLFIWTGISRKSEKILKDQNLQIKRNKIQDNMLTIKNICREVYEEISKYDGKNFHYLRNFFIKRLNDTWEIKKTLHKEMTNPQIEKIIRIINIYGNNELGIKLLGAGAGGFIMVTGVKNPNLLKNKLLKSKLLSLNTNIDMKGSIFYGE
jgi:D-glycero-alpha-D-manno-heptose-7-phosphate kinase